METAAAAVALEAVLINSRRVFFSGSFFISQNGIESARPAMMIHV
jgi:hypothetical protein